MDYIGRSITASSEEPLDLLNLNSDLLPATDNTFNIGQNPNKRWKSLAAVDVYTNRVHGLTLPTAADHATNKFYVDQRGGLMSNGQPDVYTYTLNQPSVQTHQISGNQTAYSGSAMITGVNQSVFDFNITGTYAITPSDGSYAAGVQLLIGSNPIVLCGGLIFDTLGNNYNLTISGQFQIQSGWGTTNTIINAYIQCTYLTGGKTNSIGKSACGVVIDSSSGSMYYSVNLLGSSLYPGASSMTFTRTLGTLHNTFTPRV